MIRVFLLFYRVHELSIWPHEIRSLIHNPGYLFIIIIVAHLLLFPGYHTIPIDD